MKNTQVLTDKFSIGLSVLCTIHCLVLPFLLALLPSLGAWQLHNEAFHAWMLVAVVPTSIYALTLGCKKHQRYRLFFLGISGLSLMVLALLLGHEIIGELGEKSLTLLGASLIAVAHWGNFKRCQAHKECTD